MRMDLGIGSDFARLAGSHSPLKLGRVNHLSLLIPGHPYSHSFAFDRESLASLKTITLTASRLVHLSGDYHWRLSWLRCLCDQRKLRKLCYSHSDLHLTILDHAERKRNWDIVLLSNASTLEHLELSGDVAADTRLFSEATPSPKGLLLPKGRFNSLPRLKRLRYLEMPIHLVFGDKPPPHINLPLRLVKLCLFEERGPKARDRDLPLALQNFAYPVL
ncbi:hypothetical protein B0T26DRAFT_868324 [Lasiosphaeria miniovina]|uniref:Uncharacterized protein n=1 Tax=Lasiosphaeria miniovina TaxID=1954250 RepID=A0AA40B3B8_9PEZI|nr:uncharacterized protein B0T26DRAFT_868324 [Lasiosphaeria miniovina]KAK0726926.1 hypothetical protein B0T26DRAFT_868324 [Lasiosphaeria miniovina]